MVAGTRRSRAERTLAALGRQTLVDQLEIVVVDLAPESTPPLTAPGDLRVDTVRRPELRSWGPARAAGARHARAPVVAFVEEHCRPEPGWAQAVLAAHEGPWAAVGYAFTNANPESWASRSFMIAAYGDFAHPARGGPARLVSGNNVAYKREVLEALDERLDELLAIDFTFQEELRARGHQLFVEAGARAAHENFTTLAGECGAGHAYCRLMAATRARARGWSARRRVVYAIGAPLGAPAVRLTRLARGLRGRRALWRPFVVGLPLILPAYLWTGIGEGLGYLLGVGSSEARALEWELEAERAR